MSSSKAIAAKPRHRIPARLVLSAAAAFLLSACAAPYHAERGGSGYSDWPQGETGVYTVFYSDKGIPDRGRLRDFLLLRCAQLTLEKGRRYFVVTSTFRQGGPSGTSSGTGAHGSAGAPAGPGVGLTIRMLRTKPVDLPGAYLSGSVYNATDVYIRLTGKYDTGLPPPGKIFGTSAP